MRVFRDILRSWSPASSATNLPAKESHTITISEATPRASLSQDSIEIKIQVDTIDISPRTGPCRIHDPFSRDDHEECDWYFQCLREEDYNEDRADKIVPAVKGYGGRLMSGLKWPEHTFKHPNIIIDVLQGRENGNDRTNNASIYHIHWEQLEQVQKQHWPGLAQTADPLEVHVRRVLEHPPVQRARKVRQDKEINVLLVIARRLQPKSSKEDLSPAMVYRSIVKVKKLLRNEHSHYNLNLEVVRPGTYEALVDHLARKNIEHGGTGFFQLIHFDLHGEVSKKGEQQEQHRSYLSFANSSGKLSRVPAEDIAKLLHEHEISSVVLTACESGRSNKGDDANLCRIFAANGVSHILAMSFDVHEQAIEILCDSFYRHLLVDGETFSESARHARLDLFEKPERAGVAGRRRDLEDWFIPVAYVPKEERPFVQRRADRLPHPSSSHLDVQMPPFIHTGSYESGRSNISYRDFDLGLDLDILRLEDILMRVGNVLLRGPIVEKNEDLVKCLLESWKSTGSLGGYVQVEAEEFFAEDHDRRAKEILAQVQRISKKSISKRLRDNYIEPRGAFEKKALRKAAIKLTGIDKLFPSENLVSKNTSEVKLAVERFRRFLEIVILNPKKNQRNDYKVPFLIIIGDDPRDRLKDIFINQFSELGLERVFRDRPFDMFAVS